MRSRSDGLEFLFFADTHLGFDLPARPRIERRRRGPDFFANFERALAPALAGEKNRSKRMKAWKIASSLGSDLGKQMYTRYMVEQGLARVRIRVVKRR